MLRFQTSMQVAAIADEQIDNQFEVVMPNLSLYGNGATNRDWTSLMGIANNLGLTSYTPIVEQITFGVRNYKTNTRRVRTGWCNVPEDIENYHDVVITMFCSAGMLTQYYLNAWRRLMFDDDGEYYNPMYVYKKNIHVYIYGPGNVGISTAGTTAMHLTLKGCFPYKQDDYKLQYSENPKRLTITANFKVDKIVADSSYKTAALAAETITSPTGLLDRATSALFSSSDDYQVLDTYD